MHENAEETDPTRKTESAPTERAYIHQACGGTTVVSGNDFSRLANPFAFVSSTVCATCKTAASLGTFSWADTGESLTAYRRRLRRTAPLALKICGWVVAPLVALALGAGIGWLVARQDIKGPIIGGFLGLLIGAGFVMPLLAKWVWGIDYRAAR
jgi:hypothetical protein